jgi:hypothetical protein
MKTTNEYPIKTLHTDIDRTIKAWSNELYPICFGRDHSTGTITIKFAERPKKNITKKEHVSEI